MQTQQQEERRQLISRVLALDPTTLIYSGLGANVGMIESEIEREIREGHVDWMAYDAQNIHRIAVAKTNSGALCANPRIVEAFQTVFADPQFTRKSGVGANEHLILAELVNRDLPPTVENIAAVIVDLWDSLTDNQNFRDNKAETDRRNAQIAAMTDGGTRGFSIERGSLLGKTAYDKDGRKHDPMAGQAQGGSMALKGPWSRGAGSKSFDEMTNEEVGALYQEWKTTTDLRNMPVEDLKKLVRSNGTTDAFGKNVRVPSAPAPDTQDHLHHPESGEAFTQKSLIRYINAAPYNGRDLITRNGRIVPRLRELFEQTVRGELG